MSQLTRRLTILITVTALLFGVASCETLGLPKPETLSQQLATSYGTVSSVRQSATTLLQAGKISADDAAHVQAQADNVRAGLDIARSIGRTDPKAGQDKLTAVRTGLVGLQHYLVAKETK